MSDQKPSVLILGGCGFIGRNLVHYIASNNLASKVRVVDKVLPSLAWLNAKHTESFSKVEFKHANLINPASVEKAFANDDGGFTYVINCAGETKLGQSDAVYKDGILKLSSLCAEQAVKQNTQCYVEMSEAGMLASEKEAITEDCACDPWTTVARFKLKVEDYLKTQLPQLNYVILRPALVYGPGDRTGLTKRMIIAGIYKYLQEKLQVLWSPDLHINTVHVQDVARAAWHVCSAAPPRSTFNLVDQGNTCQSKIGSIVSSIFDIEYEYLNSFVVKMAKMQMTLEEIAEDANEKHTVAWGEACLREGITNTPLTPILAQEHLEKKDLFVDGSKIESTGFTYELPQISKELLMEVLDDFIANKVFPSQLVYS